MTDEITFFVPGRPFSKKRPRFGKGRTYTDPETVAGEEALWHYARRALPEGFMPFDCVISLTMDLRFAFPPSYSAKRRVALEGAWYGLKPDWDNAGKMSDAFNPKIKGAVRAGLWTDDARVAWAQVLKRWVDADHPEGTTVTVRRL